MPPNKDPVLYLYSVACTWAIRWALSHRDAATCC